MLGRIFRVERSFSKKSRDLSEEDLRKAFMINGRYLGTQMLGDISSGSLARKVVIIQSSYEDNSYGLS